VFLHKGRSFRAGWVWKTYRRMYNGIKVQIAYVFVYTIFIVSHKNHVGLSPIALFRCIENLEFVNDIL
jgi:hypothetical protein